MIGYYDALLFGEIHICMYIRYTQQKIIKGEQIGGKGSGTKLIVQKWPGNAKERFYKAVYCAYV